MKNHRILRIAAPVLGALLLGGAAVAVTASAAGLNVGSLLASSSPAPTASPSAGSGKGAAACQVFLGHLASQLGVSSGKLNAAAIAAGKQTIQDAVSKGQLTQAQATRIEGRLSGGDVCKFGSALGAGAGERGKPAGATQAYLAAAASALGVSQTQLMTDLKGGQTLSQVAAAQGVSEDQFRAKVVGALKPKLDQAVKAGKLTQAQEDAALAKLQSGDPPLWNGLPHRGATPSPAPSASA